VTGLQGPERPQGSAPLSYITTEGLLRVPMDVRAQLHLPDGGGVVFDAAGDGKVTLSSTDAWIREHGEG